MPKTKRRPRKAYEHGPHEPWPGRGSLKPRRFLVAVLLEGDETHDHADVEDTLNSVFSDFAPEYAVLSVTAREVKA